MARKPLCDWHLHHRWLSISLVSHFRTSKPQHAHKGGLNSKYWRCRNRTLTQRQFAEVDFQLMQQVNLAACPEHGQKLLGLGRRGTVNCCATGARAVGRVSERTARQLDFLRNTLIKGCFGVCLGHFCQVHDKETPDQSRSPPSRWIKADGTRFLFCTWCVDQSRTRRRNAESAWIWECPTGGIRIAICFGSRRIVPPSTWRSLIPGLGPGRREDWRRASMG